MGKKAQFMVPLILLVALLMAIVVFGMMGGLQGAMQVALSNSNITDTERFAVYLVPFVFVIFIIFWTVYNLRGGG